MTVRAFFNFLRAKMEEINRSEFRGVFNMNDIDSWETELQKKEKNAERKGIAKAVSNPKGTGRQPSAPSKQ